METLPRQSLPCKVCPDKPCEDNPYNTDQDCWYHPGQELIVRAMIEIARTVKQQDEYAAPLKD